MFLGLHPVRVDEKWRVTLPAKFRDEMAGGVVVTKGQERCLYVFPRAEFESYTDKVRQASLTAKIARDFARVLFGSAFDALPDRQGRVSVPQHLREYAGIDRDCVVVGADTRVEIWSADAWARYEAEAEASFAELSEEVLPGIF
jgi:MraZ protein